MSWKDKGDIDAVMSTWMQLPAPSVMWLSYAQAKALGVDLTGLPEGCVVRISDGRVEAEIIEEYEQ